MDPATMALVGTILQIVLGIITWHNNQPLAVQQDQALQVQTVVDSWLKLPHLWFPQWFPAPLLIPLTIAGLPAKA
jgi:hypothetical protein